MNSRASSRRISAAADRLMVLLRDVRSDFHSALSSSNSLRVFRDASEDSTDIAAQLSCASELRSAKFLMEFRLATPPGAAPSKKCSTFPPVQHLLKSAAP